MRAGKLRHRVTIQKLPSARTLNDYSQDVSEWQDEATVWAEVLPLGGRELVNARQVQADVTHQVSMRYRSGVTPEKQLVHKGRVLKIESVRNDEELGVELILLCKEKV